MRNHWTRILAILLAVMLLLGTLASCKDNATTPDNPDQPDTGDHDNGEYTLPMEEGKKQLTLYWNDLGGVNVETSDIWMWWDGKDGSGYRMHACEYGAKVVVNVPAAVEQVGFIVRTDCSDPGGSSWGSATKDGEADRFAVLTGDSTVIYLKSGDSSQYRSADGGKTLEKIKLFTIANLMSLHSVQYNVTPAVRITSPDAIRLYEGDRRIPLTEITSLGNETVTGVIKTEEELDVTKAYRLEIDGYGSKPVVPLGVFGSSEFAEKYHYDGFLGSRIVEGGTEFKVWAPTASRVVLNLYDAGNGGEAKQKIEMTPAAKGVWETTVQGCGHGTYYTYSVTTSVGEQEAVDPYARTAGVNGNRGMVLDLSLTDPEGWENVDYMHDVCHYTDAVIWEVHVRDFSNRLTSSKYPGKYLAFTERGLVNSAGVPVGVDYLVKLGITHVHLMPVYDYATVDESDPNSGYNWGYDPKNYNVPEGSYSTDPYHGEVRVKEFKQMVQALHNAGLAVVMDVVYNHTYDANSSLNKIVPYYYYRYTTSGANSSASGCGNDTASERYMYRRFMVDSVTYWMETYKLDGFRFDLMGLHDLKTMDEIEKAVHRINKNAILYGEGWTMGSTTDGSKQANQTNIGGITATTGAAGAVSVFNDVIRDGLKGSVFNATAKGYISGAGAANYKAIQFGMLGGGGNSFSWKAKNAGVINYMSCHDNLALWDKLALSNPDDSVETRLAMNRLGISILMASQGTPLWQAGEEMLRSKGGDENSYRSPDSVNNLDWEALKPGSDAYGMMEFYGGLIAMRKQYRVFRATGGAQMSFNVDTKTGAMMVTIDNHQGNYACVLLNPTAAACSFQLTGEWKLLSDGSRAGTDVIRVDSGKVSVPAYSALIYVR